MLFTQYRTRKDVTEDEAIKRLVSATEEICKNAVWNSFSGKAKISELRAPLAELKIARRRLKGGDAN